MKALTNCSDAQLINLYTQGNTDALGIVIERHKAKILSSIEYWIKDPVLAEDMFQDLCIKIMTLIETGRYKENDAFFTWALRVGHNMCVDYLRTQHYNPLSSKIPGDKYIFESKSCSEFGADKVLLYKENRSQISKMVDMLPEKMRDVFLLRYNTDLTYRIIGKSIGIRSSTARSFMRNALINFRKLIAEKQVEF